MSLYSEVFYSDEINELFSDEKSLSYLLLFESSLAKAQVEHGIVPNTSAGIIASCSQADLIDLQALKKAIQLGGNVAIPLVKQLTQLVKNQDAEAAKFVHFGATSQDVVDTTTVLQTKVFVEWLENQLNTLQEVLIKQTQEHRQTLMIGRTLLQQAKPITFGLKMALCLESIQRSAERIQSLKGELLVLQLAGAVGSQNQAINQKVKESLANILGLKATHSWHTHRDAFVHFAAVLGVLVGSIGKIAKDISLLMQTEVGEVFEGAGVGKGGSSTMPHKRNPVASAIILANAQRVPHLVATLMTAMTQEHERSAGLWHSEWEVLNDLMKLTAGTVERSIGLLSGLEVDKNRMLQNLELTQGLIYAENVSLALAEKIGKSEAHELVEKACKKAVAEQKHLKKILVENQNYLTEPELQPLFQAENAIGLSLEIIDNILGKAVSSKL
ncbi:3-carboxy-cis,cis-muconate cycloisomerase [Arcicella rosea]|uniref:3-carboxy-cis,cis-muconate cycloisomerase n=1 Tax=Arcicella rosea TaxID=502909 RepID=UPI00345DF136